MLLKTPEMHEEDSVASLTIAFINMQYLIINEGVPVSSYFCKKHTTVMPF